MKKLWHAILLVVLVNFIVNCNYKKNTSEHLNSDVWKPFANALDRNNTDFLMRNSLDSITCVDCFIPNHIEETLFSSEILFNYIEKIKHIKNLSSSPYTLVYKEPDFVFINYSVKSENAPEGYYTLTFTLKKVNKKYFFQGMNIQ